MHKSLRRKSKNSRRSNWMV